MLMKDEGTWFDTDEGTPIDDVTTYLNQAGATRLVLTVMPHLDDALSLPFSRDSLVSRWSDELLDALERCVSPAVVVTD